jgi:Sulfotransferase family
LIEPPRSARALRLYGGAVARVLARGRRRSNADLDAVAERPVLVLGSPRSGTSFVAHSIGRVSGFADLGEVAPWKGAIPQLVSLPEAEAAERLRKMLETVRRLGLVRHLRAVEQSPETAFVLGAAIRAYPQATVVHMIRDPRDVAASLLEKGWLKAESGGHDDVAAPYGRHARFWVEEGRAEDFDGASDARRAGWAWRRYVTAARSASQNTLEVRYEGLVGNPQAAARKIAEHIGADPLLLARALADVHAESVGRWRRDLNEEQVADVEAEAGPLLRELGYS